MFKSKKMFIKMLFLGLFTLIFINPANAGKKKFLMMATTTSTDNTGLLDYLKPKFEAVAGIELRWVVKGTGQALKLGENCDVDVLMVHAPQLEKKFISEGFGVDRGEIMYNDFVIIGPAGDPAGIRGMAIKESLQIIREKKIVFVSRGDNSGTHRKELFLWQTSDIPVPERERWYLQSGQGMLSTIHMATEKNGYTLTDRGTYIRYEANIEGNAPLKIMVEGDPVLLNQYSVIAVNPKHCPKVKDDLAAQFINWITGKEAQALIKEFKLLNKPLFIPNATNNSIQ